MAIVLVSLSVVASHTLHWWLGRGQLASNLLDDLIGLGSILAFSLMVGYFAEKMLFRNKMLEMANAKLQMLAMTDELTRLYNHRYFQMRLEEEIQRSNRQNNHLSLIILDMDFFKQYNDTHGHPMGDYLLQLTSNLLREKVRVMDTVARYGGEEFVIILADTSGEQAVQVADRIRQAIQDYPFPGRETQPGGRITVSVGIASYPNNATTKEELIQRADEALYKAKKETRNAVQLSFSVSEDKSHLRLIKG
ncbi:MAG: GGDEF domain-containing protein [Clostridia bacterium]|nr:GGDEF domain-containing protein [Clostridia bacterium]